MVPTGRDSIDFGKLVIVGDFQRPVTGSSHNQTFRAVECGLGCGFSPVTRHVMSGFFRREAEPTNEETDNPRIKTTRTGRSLHASTSSSNSLGRSAHFHGNGGWLVPVGVVRPIHSSAFLGELSLEGAWGARMSVPNIIDDQWLLCHKINVYQSMVMRIKKEIKIRTNPRYPMIFATSVSAALSRAREKPIIPMKIHANPVTIMYLIHRGGDTVRCAGSLVIIEVLVGMFKK